MSNASDVIDYVRTFKFAGKDFNFRRLGKLEMLAIAENCVLQNEMKRIQMQASFLDEKHLLAFINSCYEKLPNNSELTAKAIELMNQESTKLILVLLKEALVSDLKDVEIFQLLEAATPEETEMVTNHIFSYDKKKQ